MIIENSGWSKYNIWSHSSIVKELYEDRCRLKVEEMTSHAQAAELLLEVIAPGDSLLDVGCGSGYFFHSIRSRKIPIKYFGIDATKELIEIGKRTLPEYGLHPDHLKTIRIEDLDADVDHIICLNVLSNLDNYHKYLERILLSARKTIILRESINDIEEYKYVFDNYLDKKLKVFVNTYSSSQIKAFIESYGYKVEFVEDMYTQGNPQMVIDHLHYWKFIVATKLK